MKDKNNIELNEFSKIFKILENGDIVYNNDKYTMYELLLEMHNNIGQRDVIIELFSNKISLLKEENNKLKDKIIKL